MATFSVTELGTYRRCRQQWDFSAKSRKNLTGIGAGAEPLELGSLIHQALADWTVMEKDKQTKPNILPMTFLKHAEARKQAIIDSFQEKFRRKPEDRHLDSLMNVIQLGAAMMNNYQLYHKTPLPKDIRFALPEQEVLIPVPGTEHPCPTCTKKREEAIGNGFEPIWTMEIGQEYYFVIDPYDDCEECQGKGWVFHYLSATLDGLGQDKKDRFYVIEHKTYENRPQRSYLLMNDQFTGYCWVVRELGLGVVAGVAYDGMWKRAIPPGYLQKEKRKGTVDDLFVRTIIPKSDEELDQWGKNLTKIIKEMGSDPPIYPNVPWQGCNDCSFQTPCRMKMLGEDPTKLLELEYTQREIVRGGKLASA